MGNLRRLLWCALLLCTTACSRDTAPEIRIMNNHSEALFIWAERGVKNRVVVHVDAHSDFRHIPDPDLAAALELLRAGRRDELRKRTNSGADELVTLGNYLFAAAKAGMAREIYWVSDVFPIASEAAAVAMKQQLLSDGLPRDEIERTFRFSDGRVSMTLYGVPFTVTSSGSLPRSSEPVLLDIDIDYFVRLLEINPGKTLFDHVADFRRDLLAARLSFDIVTIARSLDMDYTPLEYSRLAEAMRELTANPRRELTGPFWAAFRGYSDADALFRAGRLPEALAANRALRERNPQEPALHYQAARILAAQGDAAGALQQAEEAGRLDRDYVRGLATLGLLFVENNRPQAEAFFAAAGRLAPQDRVVSEKRAELYYNNGQYREAVAEYGKIYNGSFVLNMYLGDAHLQLRNYSTALAYYDRGLTQLRSSSNFKPAPVATSFLLLGDYYRTVGRDPVRARQFFALYLAIPRTATAQQEAVAQVRQLGVTASPAVSWTDIPHARSSQ
jgi:tetratricopeptide (TPR) repeat protein